MNYDEAHRKYLNDPQFRVLVDQMVEMIRSNVISVGELREAATFAATIFERRTVRQTLGYTRERCHD